MIVKMRKHPTTIIQRPTSNAPRHAPPWDVGGSTLDVRGFGFKKFIRYLAGILFFVALQFFKFTPHLTVTIESQPAEHERFARTETAGLRSGLESRGGGT